MSLIDEFFVVFKTQGLEGVEQQQQKAREGAEKLGEKLKEAGDKGEEAGKKIEEENSRLAESFDKVKEHVGEWGRHIVEQSFEVAAAFQALFEVEKLVDSVFETAEQSDQLGERAKSLGIEVQELDAWGNAAKRVGGSADAFGESLVNINRQITRLEDTGKSRLLPFFQQLGLSASELKKPLMELLPDIVKAVDGKPRQQTTGALRGIGFDEGTIRLLQRGTKEVGELIERQRLLGLVTEEDAETAEKFNIEWDDIKQLFHSIVVAFDTEVLPLLEDLLDGVEIFIEFLRAHKNFAIGFFIGLGAAVIYCAEAFGILDAAIAVLMSPITGIVVGVTALITAFAFLYDDLLAFAAGNKSVIGELSKTYPIIGQIAQGIIEFFGKVKIAVTQGVADFKAWLAQIPEGIRQWKEILSAAGGYVSEFVSKAISDFEQLVPGSKGIFDDLGQIFSTAMPFLREIVQFGFKAIVAVGKAFLEEIGAVFHLIGDLVVNPEHAFQNFASRTGSIIDELTKKFPQLTSAFEAVEKDWHAVGDAIIKLFHDIEDAIAGSIGRIEGWFKNWHLPSLSMPHLAFDQPGGGLGPAATSSNPLARFGSSFFSTPPAEGMGPAFMPTQQAAGVPPGVLAGLPASPDPMALGAVPSPAIAAGSPVTNNTNTITVQGSTINATSSDPEHIKAAFDDHLEDVFNNALNQLSNGTTH